MKHETYVKILTAMYEGKANFHPLTVHQLSMLTGMSKTTIRTVLIEMVRRDEVHRLSIADINGRRKMHFRLTRTGTQRGLLQTLMTAYMSDDDIEVLTQYAHCGIAEDLTTVGHRRFIELEQALQEGRTVIASIAVRRELRKKEKGKSSV